MWCGAASPPQADIGKVAGVTSSFGPEFKLDEIAKRPFDSTFFTAHRLPPNLAYDPPECAKPAQTPDAPPGVRGSMAAVSAEGDGNRFIVMAMQMSPPLPLNDPSHHCGKVTFSGTKVRGSIQTIEAPQIDGARTSGIHRVVQMQTPDATRTRGLYHYAAQFGDSEVIVIATPVADADQAAEPCTDRAGDLLVRAVAAIRS